jgi:hypothetical protein
LWINKFPAQLTHLMQEDAIVDHLSVGGNAVQLLST